jgi:lysyl-tRNA synthetase class 2
MEDNDLLKIRLEKIAALKEAGINLYPNNVKPQNTTSEIFAEFGDADGDTLTKLTRKFSIAGRLMAMRNFGKAAFIKIQDRKGQTKSDGYYPDPENSNSGNGPEEDVPF